MCFKLLVPSAFTGSLKLIIWGGIAVFRNLLEINGCHEPHIQSDEMRVPLEGVSNVFWGRLGEDNCNFNLMFLSL